MKSRWRLALAATALCLAALVLIPWIRAPRYEGKTASYWVSQLTKPGGSKTGEAEAALKALGPKAVPYLAKAVNQRSSLYSKHLSKWWFRLPDFIKKAVPDPHRNYSGVYSLLSAQGLAAKKAMPALLKAMDDPDYLALKPVWIATNLAGVAFFQGRQGFLIFQNKHQVIVCTKQNDMRDIIRTATAIDPTDTRLVKFCFDFLQSRDSQIVSAATYAIASELEFTANLSHLKKLAWAVETHRFSFAPPKKIKAITSEGAQFLLETLEHPDPKMKLFAARLLILHTDYKEPIDTLASLAKSSPYQRFAIDELARVKIHKDFAAEHLKSIAEGSSSETALSAYQALNHLQPNPETEMAIARIRMKDPESLTRWHGLQYFIKISKGSPEAVPLLRDFLSNPDGRLRANACESLGNFGGKAEEAIPDLQNLLQDPNIFVRQAAAAALEKIRAADRNSP